MNWLTNFIRPKIRSFVAKKDVPDNLWQKCPSCEGMLFHRDLLNNMNVCYHCGHHMKIGVRERLATMFDDGAYETIELPRVSADPLKFKDRKKYADRLKEAQGSNPKRDVLVVGSGRMGGIPVVIAAMDFTFMGGSMGSAVGEGLVRAAETAVLNNAALIAIPSSGGARMQEGMLSLMQMPRSIIAVEMVKDAGLPYVVIMTDPTTGGVSASFAMVGDIHIAEPGAMIGFAGKRVIEETIREKLPEGFQSAEYLLQHGMLDMVVARKDMRDTLIRLLSLLMRRRQTGSLTGGTDAAAGNGNGKGRKGKDGGKAAGTVAKLTENAGKAISKFKPANTQNDSARRKRAARS